MQTKDGCYVFLDTETTGLEKDDEVWEVAFIAESFAGRELGRGRFTTHHNIPPSKWVAENTEYFMNFPNGGRVGDGYLSSAIFEIYKLVATINGYTPGPRGNIFLVGANPTFDDRKIRESFPYSPFWHYRLIDVETYCMGLFAWSAPRSLADLATELGVQSDEALHTASGDTQRTRDIFRLAQLVYGPPK